MSLLSMIVRILCLVPVLTGLLDVVIGSHSLAIAGMKMPPGVLENPVLESQVRFFGMIWIGWGLALWRTSGELRANAGWFRGLLGILFLSGLARAAAALQFGLPGGALNAAIIAELVGVPLLLAWHTTLLRKIPEKR
ncbi:DUF4345 domain-containing protein [Rhizobium mongolense]|uniref:DUF4345 domain-containing protein n=1 Tax=Rhizobium mongolense TaxID=57676 RepID=A0A7W6RTJ8_9HYPH|nr:DUF4345 domain-containing protein [Rhizobium mongolense]MBB4278365.1 hypothetical protein [Rhizobium mongolense]